MDNEAYKDILPDGEEQVSRLLGSLPRVAAPADFDIRVRSWIARGRPAENRGFRLPVAVTYALGLGVVLLAFGLGGFVWLYSGSVPVVPPVAIIEPYAPVAQTTANGTGNELPHNANSNNVQIASRPPEPPALPRLQANDPNVRSRSIDVPERDPLAITEARKVYPKGINPNIRTIPNSKDIVHGRLIAAKDVLVLIGAATTSTAGGWRVDTVNPNTTAERVGLKAGDVIEAINDQPVTKNTAFSGSFSGKSLRVNRGGLRITIELDKK